MYNGTWRVAVVVATLALLLARGAVSHAQLELQDLDVSLAIDLRDRDDWLPLHQEVLGTPREFPKQAVVSVPTRTGETRSIAVSHPAFTIEMISGDNRRISRIVLTGKIAGSEALRGLTEFEQSLLDIASGAVPNQLEVQYGISGLLGQMLQFRVTRP
jgi:hypothetical protein